MQKFALPRSGRPKAAYRVRRTKAPELRRTPALFVLKSGRDGGGKSRPDYGPPNLSPQALNVVRVRFSLVKTRLDAGRCIAHEGGAGVEGTPPCATS